MKTLRNIPLIFSFVRFKMYYNWKYLLYSKENDQIKTIEKEIEATKKHFLKETEKNEKLEQFKKRLTEDYNHLNKQC